MIITGAWAMWLKGTITYLLAVAVAALVLVIAMAVDFIIMERNISKGKK